MSKEPKKDSDVFEFVREPLPKTIRYLFIISFVALLILFFTFIGMAILEARAEARATAHDFSFLSFVRDTGKDLGETYVIWHSLFDTLAFTALFLTLYFQVKDIYQKEEQFKLQQQKQDEQFKLKHQQQEEQFKLQQQKQDEQFNLQQRERDEQFNLQQFQSVFFPGLTLFQTFLDNLQNGSLRGRRIFHELRHRIKDFQGGAMKPSNELMQKLDKLDAGCHSALTVYLQRLGTLLFFVLEAKIEEHQKAKFFEFLTAQLSTEEVDLVRFCVGFDNQEFVPDCCFPRAKNIRELLEPPFNSESSHQKGSLAHSIRSFLEIPPKKDVPTPRDPKVKQIAGAAATQEITAR